VGSQPAEVISPGGANETSVYIPEHFRVRDQAAAIAFMRSNPFAILVSNAAEGPFATHVPVVIREHEDRITLRGHVAKANPHWRYIEQQPLCLVIFHGPHAYISPSHYNTRESVPTWNYGAVHAYGKARVYSEHGELLNMLHDLIPTFEAAYQQQWESLSKEYQTRMLGHIVGFEIPVEKIEAKFKMSQNRAPDEQQNIIDALSPASDSTVSGTARLMRDQGLGRKKG
jgi:transcriptional regulator